MVAMNTEEEARKWIKDNQMMLRGNNTEWHLIFAYVHGAKGKDRCVDALRLCERTLEKVMACRANDGTKCAPNEQDFKEVRHCLNVIEFLLR